VVDEVPFHVVDEVPFHVVDEVPFHVVVVASLPTFFAPLRPLGARGSAVGEEPIRVGCDGLHSELPILEVCPAV